MMAAVEHAPYAVLGDVVIAYGRTTKTACGKRVQTDRLVSRDDTTCPCCRRAVERDRTEAAAMRALAEDTLRAYGCPHCGAPFDDVAAWNDHRAREHRRDPA
jgi:hypothetical protein